MPPFVWKKNILAGRIDNDALGYTQFLWKHFLESVWGMTSWDWNWKTKGQHHRKTCFTAIFYMVWNLPHLYFIKPAAMAKTDWTKIIPLPVNVDNSSHVGIFLEGRVGILQLYRAKQVGAMLLSLLWVPCCVMILVVSAGTPLGKSPVLWVFLR